MSYQSAMETAGAVVHDFEQFGSYQGDWWAFLTYQGITGFVTGGYGSCSGCDAWEGTSWNNEHEHANSEREYDRCDAYNLKFKDGCEKCAAFREEIAEFGRPYLKEIMPYEKALETAKASWEEPLDAVKFVEKHKAL
jgi:hypothetical protein